MNKIPKKDLFLIVTSFLFILFSFYSVYNHFNSSTRDLNKNVTSWNNGLRSFINDLKNTTEITDYSEGRYSLKRFSSPPVLLTSSPDSNMLPDEITYYYDTKKKSLIKKINSEETELLKNINQISISMIDFKGNTILEKKDASGFRVFIVFNHDKKNIPIDFTVFSEYLFSSKKYSGFFDYIDNKRFY